MARGHAGFERLRRGDAIHEVAGLAHIRRKFIEMPHAQGSAIAEEATARNGQLHEGEVAIRGSPPGERARSRQDRAAPSADDLEASLTAPPTSAPYKTTPVVALRLTRPGA